VLLASQRDIEGSLEEVRRWANHAGVAVSPYVPYGVPLDHPDLEPSGCSPGIRSGVVLHAYNTMPPYAPAPGHLGKYVLTRSSTRGGVECATCALIGNGVMDRYRSCASAPWKPVMAVVSLAQAH